MAKVSIEQPHTLALEEAKRRLQELADKLSAKYGIEANWTSDHEAALKRTGVTGKILVAADKVSVMLDLSFALFAVKGKIEERIKHELKTTLA